MWQILGLVPLPTDDLSALERWAIWLAAVAAGMVALGAIASRIRRAYRFCRAWIRDALRRAAALESLVQHELRPNSGGSLHDAVHRLDRRVETLERSLETMAQSQTHMWPAIEAIALSEPNNHERINQ